MPQKKSAPKPTAKSVTEQLIREIAHKLWIEEGHPEGRADQHWYKAVEIANGKKAAAARKADPKSATPKAVAGKAPAEKKPATAKVVVAKSAPKKARKAA